MNRPRSVFRSGRPFWLAMALGVIWPCAAKVHAEGGGGGFFNALTVGNLGGQGSASFGWSDPWVAGAAAGLSTEVVNTSSSGAISVTPAGGSAINGGARAVDVYPPATGGTNTAARTGIVATRQLAAAQSGTFYAGFVMKWVSCAPTTAALHFPMLGLGTTKPTSKPRPTSTPTSLHPSKSLSVVQSSKYIRLIGYLFFATGCLVFLRGLLRVLRKFRTLGSALSVRG